MKQYNIDIKKKLRSSHVESTIDREMTGIKQ